MITWTSYLQELSIALLGAASFYFVRMSYRFYLNKKYSMSGMYISRTEDTQDGERVVEKCRFKLKQKGLKVIGREMHPDGRTWLYQGNIFGTRHLSGIFRNEDVNSPGVGSFFLEHQGQDFKGTWTGTNYADKEKNQIFIDHGSYELIRTLDPNIRALTQDRVPQVVHLIDKLNLQKSLELDPDFDTDNSTERSFKLNDKRHVNLLALKGQELLGFVVGFQLAKTKLASLLFKGELPKDLPLVVKHADADGQIGILKSIAVQEKHRRRGVGTKLIETAESKLKSLGARVVLVPYAVTPGTDKNTISGMMEFLNYESLSGNEGNLALYTKVL